MTTDGSPPNRKRDYEVGYGRPPKHSRFKKGQSGNPSGRRRYTETRRAQQLVRQELYRTVTVREGRKLIRMPAIQAILRKQVQIAAQGNVSAMKELLKTLQLIEAAKDAQANNFAHEDIVALLEEER